LQQPLKEIQQKYSEIINEIIAYDFLSTEWKENDVIYFPVYFDFRGRKYYDSIVGPTNLKITRFMFNYGYYNKNEFINEVKIKKIWNMTEEIKNMCIKLDFVYKDCFYESYYWLLIGIGKHLIKNRIKIHKNEFIKKSIDFLLEIIQIK
jgi:hypothetical protein